MNLHRQPKPRKHFTFARGKNSTDFALLYMTFVLWLNYLFHWKTKLILIRRNMQEMDPTKYIQLLFDEISGSVWRSVNYFGHYPRHQHHS